MEDLKKKINIDSTLLYYSTPNENKNDELKSSIMNMETYNSTNRKYVCTVCGKRFFTKNSLTAHMEHHSPDETINSDKDKDDSNSDWKNRFVLNKGISCNKAECNFIALDGVDYNKHLANCEGVRVSKDNNDAFCELCDCYFSCKNYFKAHSTLQHTDNSPDISLQEQDEKNTKVSDPVCLYLQENKSDSGNGTKKNTTYCMHPDTFVNKKKLKDVESGSDVSSPHSSERETLSVNGDASLPVDESSNNDLNRIHAEIILPQKEKQCCLNDKEKTFISEHVADKNNVDAMEDIQNENKLTNETTAAADLIAFSKESRLKYSEPLSEHVPVETTEIVKDSSSSENSVNSKEVSNEVAESCSISPAENEKENFENNWVENVSKNSSEAVTVEKNDFSTCSDFENKEKCVEITSVTNDGQNPDETLTIEKNDSVVHSVNVNNKGDENSSKDEVNSSNDTDEVDGSCKNVCKVMQDIMLEPNSNSENKNEEHSERNDANNANQNSSDVLSTETNESSATSNIENIEKKQNYSTDETDEQAITTTTKKNYSSDEKDEQAATTSTENNKEEENSRKDETDSYTAEVVPIAVNEPSVIKNTKNKEENKKTEEVVHIEIDEPSVATNTENNEKEAEEENKPRDEKNVNTAEVIQIKSDELLARTNTENKEEENKQWDKKNKHSTEVVQIETGDSSTAMNENNEEENRRKDEKDINIAEVVQIKIEDPSTTMNENNEEENKRKDEKDINIAEVVQIEADKLSFTTNTEDNEKENRSKDDINAITAGVIHIEKDESSVGTNTGNNKDGENMRKDEKDANTPEEIVQIETNELSATTSSENNEEEKSTQKDEKNLNATKPPSTTNNENIDAENKENRRKDKEETNIVEVVQIKTAKSSGKMYTETNKRKENCQADKNDIKNTEVSRNVTDEPSVTTNIENNEGKEINHTKENDVNIMEVSQFKKDEPFSTMNSKKINAPENKHVVKDNVDIVCEKSALTEYLGVEKMIDGLFQEDILFKHSPADVNIPLKSKINSVKKLEASKSEKEIQSVKKSLQLTKTSENVKKNESKKNKKCSQISIVADRPKTKGKCEPIKKKYLKSYDQVKQSDNNAQNKFKIGHSSPKTETFHEKKSDFGSAKAKNRTAIKKKRVPVAISEDLNVKQRSVRQRKKLILPDFEYGFDNKNAQLNTISSSSKRNENSFMHASDASSVSKGENDNLKKRGKTPVKRTADNSDLKIQSKSISFDESIESSASYSTGIKKRKIVVDDQAEEFSLNSTVIEPESCSSFSGLSPTKLKNFVGSLHQEVMHEEEDDDDQHDDSWLKKVDFSEHTAFDSWAEEPTKKKNGRSRKIKSTSAHVSGPKNVTKKNYEAKKSGKQTEINHVVKNVKNIMYDTIECIETEISMIDDDLDDEPLSNRKKKLQNKFKQQQQNMSSTIKSDWNHVSPKRGRPCKVKPTDATSNLDSKRTSIDVTGANCNKLKNSKSTTYQKMQRKTEKSLSKQENYSPRKKDKFDTFQKRSTGAIYEKYSNFSKKPLKGHAEKKHAMKDEDSASIKNIGSNEKQCKSSIFRDDSHNQTKVPIKGKLIKGGKPKKSEKVTQKELNLSPTKVKKRKQNLLNNLELLPKKKSGLLKGKFGSHDPIVNIEPISNKAVPSDTGLIQSEKLIKTADPMKDINLTATIKTEPQSCDNEDVAVTHANTIPTKGIRKPKNIFEKVPNGNEEDNFVPDITTDLDETLYLKDVRNRTRYSKVFKKQILTPKKGEHSDSLVTCGRCKKRMTLLHYTRNHQFTHYFLCWLEGEPEINMNDDCEVIKILQAAINPEALRKKAIRLMCERCQKTMKSVIGYVSHVRFCKTETDEDELFEKCTLCGKALKPSSIRHHYIKFHGVNKFTMSDSKMIPDIDNVTNIKRHTLGISSSPKKNYLMGFERVPVQKTDILHDEVFWKSLKTSYDLYMCMGLSCRHMTLSKDDLKSHILSCGASFCEFSCSFCPYKTKYESEIIYHSKNKCKESSDVEDNDNEKENGNENENENENDEPVEENSKLIPERRLSTRVKKRKYLFDFDEEEERKKSKSKVSKSAVEDDVDFEIKSENDDESEVDSDLPEKKSRFNKKKSDNSSSRVTEESGLRQGFIQQNWNKIADPLNYTVEIRLKTFSTSPTHTKLKVDINEWETFPISELPKYSPVQYKSAKVSFDCPTFTEYKLFQSDVIKGVPVCYTGGPVWSMAWAPLPALITEQYLAVAGLQHMNQVAEIEVPLEFPSMVQIWKFSSLDNISNDIHIPMLAWAIAHNYGIVWSMEWCPSGGFDNSSTPCRLGILALATSAGCVVVYSVPRLDCGGETRSIVANPEPDLILKTRNNDVQCTRVVWQRNNPHNVVFGGFSNGTVALWDICTSSTILKNGKILYPYKTIEAHNSSITVLDVHWMDNGRFLLTGSHDRILKYWDIEDLSGPTFETEKSTLALSAVWMQHWIMMAVGNDVTTLHDPTVYLGHPRDLVDRKKQISSVRDTFWSVAYSDWNDAVAFSSNGGNVFAFAAKHLSALTFKQPEFEKMVTETKLLPLPPDQKNDSQSVEKSIGLPKTNSPYDCSSLVENYGIQFCNRVLAKPNTNELNFSVENCNVTSVNKVCWNQNYNSFNWLALGYECGFVRVMRVERFDKHHLTKFYKMNENSSITLM